MKKSIFEKICPLISLRFLAVKTRFSGFFHKLVVAWLPFRFIHCKHEAAGKGSGEILPGLLTRLIRDDAGQDLAEYAIGLALISFVMLVAVNTMQADLQSLWINIKNLLGGVP